MAKHVKEQGLYDMGRRMPSKGMHKMSGGHMMSDAEMGMKKMMKGKPAKKKTKRN